eukprot:scaffold1189_cov122-Skeletonema_dohrnii-CCMP3373.AAC.5
MAETRFDVGMTWGSPGIFPSKLKIVIVRIFCFGRIKSTHIATILQYHFFATTTVEAVQMQSRESLAKWKESAIFKLT